MTVIVIVAPEVPPTFGANEFGDRTFANYAKFGNDALVVEQNLIDTVFTNISRFGLDRLVESAFPDVSLIDAVFTNTSTFGTDELAEAPPDEILRDAVFTNTSTFGADVLEELSSSGDTEDTDAVIGVGPIASAPI